MQFYLTVLTLSSTSAVLAAVPTYGQCGGNGFTGETACESGAECKEYNPWYSQCIPGSSGSAPVGTAPAELPAASSSAIVPGPSSAAPIPSANATLPITSATAGAPSTLLTATRPATTVEADANSTSSIIVAPSTASSVAAAQPTASAGAGAGNDTAGSGANGAACALNAAFVAKGKKYFGTATDQGLLSDATNEGIIAENFGQVTPENSMKWDATEKSEGEFSFSGSDALVDYAVSNSKLVRGHGPVWHSQLPTWVSSITDKTKLEEVMTNHIQSLMGQYKGQVYAYDVVNEIFEEDGSFRSSVWYNVLGEDFVATAFKIAREADPDAKLYINEYNLDSAGYTKTKALVEKVTEWVAAGVPIDGIGSQSHLNGAWPISDFPEALKSICAVVDECAITELDIKGAAASDYTTAVQACLDVDNCVGVTVWGVSDADSWRSETTPLLFDESFQAKDAYNALCDIL